MDPVSALMVVIIYACSQHALGNSCDEDAKCWQWQNMLACHERYFGDIHTPAYLHAVAVGHNPGHHLNLTTNVSVKHGSRKAPRRAPV